MPAPERSSLYPGPFRAARPTVASHKSALLPEPILTVHEYLMKAGQDNPRWAGERDHLLLETRRPRRARRQHFYGAQYGYMRGQAAQTSQPPHRTGQSERLYLTGALALALVIWHPRGYGLGGGRWRRGGAWRQSAGDHQRDHTDRGRGGERGRDA
jgi:hypothetical protein